MKAKSKSYVTSAKTMFAALTILSKNEGTMPIRILMQEIEKTVELSAWEKETLDCRDRHSARCHQHRVLHRV